MDLPQKVTAETGFDALSHAIEAYVSLKATIIGDMFAEAAIKLISENLRSAFAKGSKNVEARCNMSIAATLASGALQASHAGLAHCMDGLVVESAKISHGAALGILLPLVMEFNLVAVPEKFAKIAELMGEKINGLSSMDAARRAPEAIRALCQDIGMVQRMSDVGITRENIPSLVEFFEKIWLQLSNMINPREVNRADIERIFNSAL
jgi:alcohol dehydrogenase